MRRLLAAFLALMLLMPAAMADGALSKSMPSPITNEWECTTDEWLADAESRALLTVCLWQDYCTLTDVTPCPADGLTDGSLVARHDEQGFLMVVIPVTDGRLTIYYLPESGSASYMWEGGDYDSTYKQEALQQHGMTVWLNDAESVTAAMEP